MIYEYDLNEILPRLVGPLRKIFDAEILAGNVIDEISSTWPMSKVNIWFKNPLTDKYRKIYPQLKYSYLGDPRNWLEDYIDQENCAMIAAKC